LGVRNDTILWAFLSDAGKSEDIFVVKQKVNLTMVSVAKSILAKHVEVGDSKRSQYASI
jgi:hypothetical protein